MGVEPLETKPYRAGDTVTANGRSFKAARDGVYISKAILKEVSLLPLGADANTSAVAAKRGKEKQMADSPNVETVVSDDVSPEIRAQRTAAVAESKRIASIQAACAGYPKIAAQAIEEGWAIEKAELEVFKAKMPTTLSIRTGTPNSGVAGRDRLTAALLIRAGHARAGEKSLGERAMQAGADLRTHSLVDVCRAALALECRDAPRDRNELVRAAFSTIDLPQALSDRVELVLRVFAELRGSLAQPTASSDVINQI